jgi:CRP/FNR family transcriptional activator FtrB
MDSAAFDIRLDEPALSREAAPINLESPAAVLAAVPWLANVPATTLDALAAQSVLHRVPSGSLLFEHGRSPTFLQLLAAGSVELLGVRGANEMLFELIEPFDLLLPAAVLNQQPYLLRARVHETAVLLLIHGEEFRRIVARDHALCLALLACQAAQFRRQVRQAKNLKLRSAENRVGAYLRALIGDAPAGATAQLPLEKRLIASQLGMTRETFSRVLAVMPANGLRVHGETLTLENPAAAMARFPLDPLIDGREHLEPLTVDPGVQ